MPGMNQFTVRGSTLPVTRRCSVDTASTSSRVERQTLARYAESAASLRWR